MEHWKIIKRYFKLNNNLIAKPRGMDGYDPCAKYDFIYQCLLHNMNHVTLHGDLDGTIDETTWFFFGYCGEVGGRLLNKKVPKQGQSTMLYDISIDFIHVRAFIATNSRSAQKDLMHKGHLKFIIFREQLTH